ncbi:hypothetical protein O3P69_008354 [Scylla paramamosain]|uniref:Uncharacterized protein n=1 Tax=Scylla paramamosain TaxID=85552 RepID=A0AAW0SJ75_SCYPA
MLRPGGAEGTSGDTIGRYPKTLRDREKRDKRHERCRLSVAGVGMPISTTARVYKKQVMGAEAESYLEWENFPYLGLLKERLRARQ